MADETKVVGVPEAPQTYTASQFAASIRAKYPKVYDNVNDEDLTKAVFEKYPVYAQKIKIAPPQQEVTAAISTPPPSSLLPSGGVLGALNRAVVEPQEVLSRVGGEMGKTTLASSPLLLATGLAPLVAAGRAALSGEPKISPQGEFQFKIPETAGEKQTRESSPIYSGLRDAVGENAGALLANPANWPLLAAGGSGRRLLNSLISGGFAAQMGTAAYGQAKDLVANWDNLPPYERARGIGNVAITSTFTALAAKHGAGEATKLVKEGFKPPVGTEPIVRVEDALKQAQATQAPPATAAPAPPPPEVQAAQERVTLAQARVDKAARSKVMTEAEKAVLQTRLDKAKTELEQAKQPATAAPVVAAPASTAPPANVPQLLAQVARVGEVQRGLVDQLLKQPGVGGVEAPRPEVPAVPRVRAAEAAVPAGTRLPAGGNLTLAETQPALFQAEVQPPTSAPSPFVPSFDPLRMIREGQQFIEGRRAVAADNARLQAELDAAAAVKAQEAAQAKTAAQARIQGRQIEGNVIANLEDQVKTLEDRNARLEGRQPRTIEQLRAERGAASPPAPEPSPLPKPSAEEATKLRAEERDLENTNARLTAERNAFRAQNQGQAHPNEKGINRILTDNEARLATIRAALGEAKAVSPRQELVTGIENTKQAADLAAQAGNERAFEAAKTREQVFQEQLRNQKNLELQQKQAATERARIRYNERLKAQQEKAAAQEAAAPPKKVQAPQVSPVKAEPAPSIPPDMAWEGVNSKGKPVRIVRRDFTTDAEWRTAVADAKNETGRRNAQVGRIVDTSAPEAKTIPPTTPLEAVVKPKPRPKPPKEPVLQAKQRQLVSQFVEGAPRLLADKATGANLSADVTFRDRVDFQKRLNLPKSDIMMNTLKQSGIIQEAKDGSITLGDKVKALLPEPTAEQKVAAFEKKAREQRPVTTSTGEGGGEAKSAYTPEQLKALKEKHGIKEVESEPVGRGKTASTSAPTPNKLSAAELASRGKTVAAPEVKPATPKPVTPAKLTQEIKGEKGFVFHATNAERLQEIADSGKLDVHKPDFGTKQSAWPDGGTEKRAFFSRDAGVVWQFAPEEGQPVVIRTKDAGLLTERTGDVFSRKPLPVEKLEFLGNDNQWHPVSELKAGKPAAAEPNVTKALERSVELAKQGGAKAIEAARPKEEVKLTSTIKKSLAKVSDQAERASEDLDNAISELSESDLKEFSQEKRTQELTGKELRQRLFAKTKDDPLAHALMMQARADVMKAQAKALARGEDAPGIFDLPHGSTEEARAAHSEKLAEMVQKELGAGAIEPPKGLRGWAKRKAAEARAPGGVLSKSKVNAGIDPKELEQWAGLVTDRFFEDMRSLDKLATRLQKEFGLDREASTRIYRAVLDKSAVAAALQGQALPSDLQKASEKMPASFGSPQAGAAVTHADVIRVLGGKKNLSSESLGLLKSIPEGDVEGLNRFIQTLKQAEAGPATPMDKVYEAWLSAMLSSPQTHMVNTVSNMVTRQVGVVDRGMAGLLDVARSKVTNTPQQVFVRQAIAEEAGLFAGFTDGVRTFLRRMASEEAVSRSKLEVHHPRAIEGKIGRMVRLPLRLLVAADELAKTISRSGTRYSLATAVALSEGRKGAALQARVGELVKNPTPEMLRAMASEAEYFTFQGEPGKITHAALRAREAIPGGRWVIPFMTTLSKIGFFTFEHTPLNYFRILSHQRMPEATWFSNHAKWDGGRLSLELAKPTVGTLLGSVVAYLASQGFVTGSGPVDRNQRLAKEATGWQPYSFHINGKYYAYNRFDPLGSLFGLGADFAEAVGSNASEQKELGTKLTRAANNAFLSKTFTQGLSQVLNTWADPERYGESFVAGLSRSLVPSVVGAIARSTDTTARKPLGTGTLKPSTIGDVLTRGVQVENIKARIPGLSQQVAPRRDLFGRLVTDIRNPLEAFISPIRRSTDLNDPVAAEVVRLQGTGWEGISPPSPRMTITEKGGNKRSIELPGGAGGLFDRYAEYRGQELYKQLSSVVNQKNYANLTDAQKLRHMDLAKNLAFKRARLWLNKELKAEVATKEE